MPLPELPLHTIADPSSAHAHDGVEALYRRYRYSILRYIESAFGNGPPDPEDAVQAAFERFANLENRNVIHNPEAFLKRSARNFVLDHRRAHKVRNAHAALEYDLGDDTDDLNAERVLSSKERFAIMERVIRGLDQRRRDVLVMNRIQGISCAEIARQLGCSQTLVKMRLMEAVTLCQRALRDAEREL